MSLQKLFGDLSVLLTELVEELVMRGANNTNTFLYSNGTPG